MVLLEREQLDVKTLISKQLMLKKGSVVHALEVVHDIEESLGLIGTTVQYCDLLEQKGAGVIDNFKSALLLAVEQE